MQSFEKLTKMCNGWLNLPVHEFAEHQKQFALELLAQLDWDNLAAINMAKTALPANSYLMRLEDNPLIAAHILTPGTLEPPTSVLNNSLDYCQCTRLLVNGTRKLNVPYAFITDFARSYLYDTDTEELLISADSPEFFARDMAVELIGPAIKDGELDEIRRSPRSAVARSLREWRARWDDQIAEQSGQSEEEAALTIDRLLVLRFLFDADIARSSKCNLRAQFSKVIEAAFRTSGAGCGEALLSLFQDIWLQWKAEIFRPGKATDDLLKDDALTCQLLREFTLLSKSKFTLSTVLESFNYGDAMEKARVRIVPEPDELRDVLVAGQSLQTVEDTRVYVDAVDEGYRAILHWFDELVQSYDRLGLHYDSTRTQEQSKAHPADLFAWSELDAKEPSGIRDKFQRAIEKGLVVYVTTPRQYRTARMLLYLHLIDHYAESHISFVEFPQIESSIQERPRNLNTGANPPNQEAYFG